MTLRTLIHILIFLIGCITLFIYEQNGKRCKFLYLAGFLIPFVGINFTLGMNFWWAMYIFPVSIIAILSKRKSDCSLKGIFALKYIQLFFVYVLLLTVCRAGIDYLSTDPRYLKCVALGWAPAQSTFRYPVQFISFIFTWGIVFTSLLMVSQEEHANALINGFITGCVVNSVIGFYLLLAFTYNLPYPQVLLTPGFTLAGWAAKMSLASKDFPIALYRLNGLGMEPKHIGSFLVLAVILLQTLKFYKTKEIRISNDTAKLIIIMTAAILTFSTGALVSIAINITLLYSANIYRNRKKIAVIVPAVLLIVIFAGYVGYLPSIQKLIEMRVGDRVAFNLDDLAKSEPKDAAFIEYAFTKPLNMILGHGTGGIDFWLINSKYLERWISERTSAITPAYLPTRLLGDVGMIGIIILLTALSKWCTLFDKEKMKAFKMFIIIGGLSLCMTSQLGLTAYLYIVGGMVAFISRRRIQNIKLKKAKANSLCIQKLP